MAACSQNVSVAEDSAAVKADSVSDSAKAPPDTPFAEAGADAVADIAEVADIAPLAELPDVATGSTVDAAPSEAVADIDPADAAEVADAPAVDVAEVADATGELPADAAVEVAVDAAADATAAVVLPPAKLGFVAQMAGKYAVVDLATVTKLAVLGNGHKHVHGLGTVPGQQTAFVPNPDDGSIDRYEQVGGNPANWKITATWPSGLKMGMVDATPDGKFLAMTAGNMAIKIGGELAPGLSKDVVVFNTDLGKTVLKMQTSSPNPVAISNNGKTAYVGNWLDHSISVIDVATASESEIVKLPTASGGNWIGPSRITLSPDEKWLLSCDLSDNAIALMPAEDLWQAKAFKTDGLAHWCEFSPDSSLFYVVTWSYFIDTTDEMANTKMPSKTLVFSTQGPKLLGEVSWTYSLAHVAAAPGTDWFFVSASFGTVLRYNSKLQLTGQLQLDPMPSPMPAMTMSF